MRSDDPRIEVRYGELIGRHLIEKFRPDTTIKLNYGTDGNPYYEIAYSCPKCGEDIDGYKATAACERCRALYYWGDREPRIVTLRSVEW